MCRHPWSYLEIKFRDIGNMLNYSLDWGRRPHPSSSGTIRWLKLKSISCHIVFVASLIIRWVLTSSRRENARIPSSVGYVIDCWIRPHRAGFSFYTFVNWLFWTVHLLPRYMICVHGRFKSRQRRRMCMPLWSAPYRRWKSITPSWLIISLIYSIESWINHTVILIDLYICMIMHILSSSDGRR